MSIAVVTGASSGMGREFAKSLDAEGKYDEIWLIARREPLLRELAGEIKTKSRLLPLDLTAEEDIDAYKNLLCEQKPDVSVLVNCAGYGKFGSYNEVGAEVSANMIDLNCTALVKMTEYTLPFMKSGSHIVELCSLSSFQPVPYIGVYGATKAFVLSYSRSLNMELRSRGIKVTAVCPGWVKTEFFDRAKTEMEDAVTYFNVMYEAKDVVRTAMRDMYKKNRDVSVHGLPVRLQVLAVKLLPHRLVMKIWLRQQKHL